VIGCIYGRLMMMSGLTERELATLRRVYEVLPFKRAMTFEQFLANVKELEVVRD